MKSIAIAGLVPTWAQMGSNIDIPFDPATDFVYLLVAIFLFLIWYGNRQTKKMRTEDQETEDQEKGRERSSSESADGGP